MKVRGISVFNDKPIEVEIRGGFIEILIYYPEMNKIYFLSLRDFSICR